MTRQQIREAALKEAMVELLQDTRFHKFLETIQELRDGAVAYAVQHTTVKDEREYLAAIGEVRCYSDILSVAEAHRQVESVPEEQPPT